MFGFSWAEILLTSAVALVVIGPEDIPKVMYQLGRVAKRIHYIKYAFSRQFEDFLREHELDVNFEAKDKVPLMPDQEYITPAPPPSEVKHDE